MDSNLNTKRIFVLGDSRTGTLSLSNYFSACGFKSVHYYDKEAAQLPHTPENQAENFRRIKEFIETSGFNAYSDYPTRLYYRELANEYPDAFFVHTVRRDTATWQRSMIEFFSQFQIQLDMVEKTEVHLALNATIREFFRAREDLHFLELCIDDGSFKNSTLLKNFIGFDSSLLLGWDNRTADVKHSIPSGRYRLINTGEIEPLAAQVQKFRPSNKGVLSEYGWIFLINDTNDFLCQLYGEKEWSTEQAERAKSTLMERRAALADLGSQYFKVIVPEKPVIYKEYLPKVFETLTPSGRRPAVTLSTDAASFVAYLDEYLLDAKSYGLLFFRGDTHPSWLGSYFIYQYTVKALRHMLGERLGHAIALGALTPSLAGYDGDVFDQISSGDKERLNDQWKDLQLSGAFEHCIRYSQPDQDRRARPAALGPLLESMRFSRPLMVTEINDDSLPTAVVFRDSTADRVVDLLAEHFRRAVFVWHKGEVIRSIVESEKPDIVLHFMAERFVGAYGDSMVAMSNFVDESPES